MPAVSIGGMLNQLTEEALKNFADRLDNPRNLIVLKAKRTKLISAIQGVAAVSANYGNIQEMLRKKQHLSTTLQIMKQEQYQGLTLLEAVKNLHRIEAEIVNYMTKDETNVDTYEIMLESKVGTESYAHYSISEKEIDSMLNIDPRTGDLILQRSSIIENNIAKKRQGEVVNPEEFEKFVTLIVNTMWKQLQDLARIVKGPHKSSDWTRYIELRAVFSLDGDVKNDNTRQAVQEMTLDDPRLSERLITMYNYYMHGGTMLSTVSYADVGKNNSNTGRTTYNAAVSGNRGHIFEAYLRRLGYGMDYTRALGESFGSKPWWAGGDVGSTQVKAMVGNVQQVQVASINSMLQLANQLIEIINRATDSNKRKEALKKMLEKKIQAKSSSNGEGYMQRLINKVAQEELLPLLHG